MTGNFCGGLDLKFDGKDAKTHVTLTNILGITGISENLIPVEELTSKGIIFYSETTKYYYSRADKNSDTGRPETTDFVLWCAGR